MAATAAHAIKRISEASGIGHATIFRIARHLRDADGTDFWPLGAVGAPTKGQEVIAYSRHLVSLLLALSVTPITDAPRLVQWMRNLVPLGASSSPPSPHHPRLILPGSTLAEALERYLDDAKSLPVSNLSIKIRRFVHLMPSVLLEGQGDDGLQYCFYGPAESEITPGPSPRLEAAPFVVFHIPTGLIDVFVELAADTRRRRIKTSRST